MENMWRRVWLGLLVWSSVIAVINADTVTEIFVETTPTPGPNDERLTQLEVTIGQLKERIGCLTEENAVLQADLADHQQPPTWPDHPQVVNNHYTGRNDCCLLDVIRADCEKKIAGLGVCRVGNGIYYFSPPLANQAAGRTWYEASDFCRQRGMELASVETALENNLLEAKVSQLVTVSPNVPFFWFGLNDQNVNLNFIWYGTGLPTAPFFDWHVGAPNVAPAANENCAGIFKNTPGITKWDDRNCLERQRFICELSQPCFDLVNVKSCPP